MIHSSRGRWLASLGVLGAATSLTTFAAVSAASAAVKDTTKPVASFTAPAAGAVVGAKVVTTIKATDNKKVTKAQLYVNGILAGTRTAAPWSLTASLARKDGTVTLEWRVYDAAGNKRIVTRKVTADTTAPTVTMTEPAANDLITGKNVTATAIAKDAGKIARGVMYLNGKIVATITTAPYQATVPLGSVIGAATVGWRIYDTAGNVTVVSRTITVVSDKIAPTLAITSPAAGDALSPTFAVTGTAGDNVGLAEIEVSICNDPAVAADIACVTDPDWYSITSPYAIDVDLTNYAASFAATGSASGPFTIKVTAADHSGNHIAVQQNVTVGFPADAALN